MAKELLIVFVYDCELCKKEEDDPQEAIIYFYPAWVNSEQRHALCSQLMGVTQFLISSFSLPNVIALQSGKFCIKKLGRYVLCVGTDRNIPDTVLETRSTILYNLIRLFHYDIESLKNTLTDEDDNLPDKLAELFQVYLPILQYATNMFGNITSFKLPKSANNVFLMAIQTLQSFRRIPGVLGGIVLYQNKVIATQLNSSLTKRLVVTDPYRIKLPVEFIETPFHLPVSVQLLNIYVELSELTKLRKENEQWQTALKDVSAWRKENETQEKSFKGSKGAKETPSNIGGMKRDVSRIFTVMEETAEAEGEAEIPDLVRDAVKARQLARLQAVTPASFVLSDKPETRVNLTTDNLPVKTNRVPIRYYSLGLPKVDSEWIEGLDSPDSSKPKVRPYYNTISDPLFPLFKANGLPVSKTLYQSKLSGHYETLKSASNTPKKKKARPRSILLKTDESAQKPPQSKRSFTLPLKSKADIGVAPVGGGGVPLTPLMAKLSVLALEGNVLETPSFAKTPLSLAKPLETPMTPLAKIEKPIVIPETDKGTKSTSGHKKKKPKRLISVVDEDLSPIGLFVFGQSNTSLLLLIEKSSAVDPDCIHTLWERSVSSLKELEKSLHDCLDHIPQTASEDYSYAVVDPVWGPLERGGAYHPHQLELITALHHSLLSQPQLTDILIRTDDSISYGYQCGQNQVFYQQNCSTTVGLPTPADLMGVVPLKAKRRLERDHGILIL